MTPSIVNAASMVINQGTQDLSKRPPVRSPLAIPQHLPFFCTFGQKGTTDAILAVGAPDLFNIYGEETFNMAGKYATHSTPFILRANQAGNLMKLKRVIPEDAGPAASFVTYMDVLPTMVDDYERNIDGSIKVNPITGEPVVLGAIPGFKVKFVLAEAPGNPGELTIIPGDQADPNSNTTSQRYPLWSQRISYRGAQGNNCGSRYWALTQKNSSVPAAMMANDRAYPYAMQMVERKDARSSATVTKTIFAEETVMFTFKKDTVDPTTNAKLFAGDVIIDRYQNLKDPRYTKIYGAFDDMTIYYENIEALLKMFHEKEVPFIDGFSDFTADEDDIHLFNFLTGVSTYNVPYHSFVYVDAPNSTRFSSSTNVYAQGGSDGTMNDEVFAKLVSAEMARYIDAFDPVQDIATNVESVMYDTGFPLETKYDLINFIGLRHDTAVRLGTHTSGGPTLSQSEDQSVAIALRTRLNMFPESDYFGTPVMRGAVFGQSGVIRNSLWTKRVPATYEVMLKCCKYQGAGNGRWTNGQNYDGAPGSIIEELTDISNTFVPASVANRFWDVGLNWIQAYDTESFFFPAMKTSYSDDTSVLNSILTVDAICQLNKISYAAWREFSGVSGLTNAQLTQRVNDFYRGRVANIFDNRFVIEPNAQVTDMDAQRGFSWTLPVKIYAGNMKNVMTTFVQAYRLDDLAAQ